MKDGEKKGKRVVKAAVVGKRPYAPQGLLWLAIEMPESQLGNGGMKAIRKEGQGGGEIRREITGKKRSL